MKKIKSILLALTVLVLPWSVVAGEQMTMTTTETAGTISEFGPDKIVVRTETSSSPMTYNSTKTTTYIDDTGTPVSMETVRSGLPVTVYYTREGDRMIANKVVIRKTTTTTSENPVYEEKRTHSTTTTTETK